MLSKGENIMELKYYVLEVRDEFYRNYNNEKDAVHDYYLSNEVSNEYTELYKIVVKDEEVIKTKLDLPDTKTKEITWYEVSGTSPYLGYKKKYRTFEDAKKDSNANRCSIYECKIDNIDFKVKKVKIV